MTSEDSGKTDYEKVSKMARDITALGSKKA